MSGDPAGSQPLNFGDTPEPHPAITTELFDDGEFAVTLFDDRAMSVHRLNDSAAAVWILCDGATAVSQIAEHVTEIFGIDAPKHDVERAIRSFRRLGVLRDGPQPIVDDRRAFPPASDST